MSLRKVSMMAVFLLAGIMLISSCMANGQEVDDEVALAPIGLFLTPSNDLLPLIPSGGSVDIPDFRMITGGGSTNIGEWSSEGILGSTVISGPVIIQLFVRGSGRQVSLSSSLFVNGEMVDSGSTDGITLLSGNAVMSILLELDETVLEEGDTISIDVEVSASFSRGLELVFGDQQNPSMINFKSSSPVISHDIHSHGELYMVLSLVPTWGEDWISEAVATISNDEESLDTPSTSHEMMEGQLVHIWEMEEYPSGEISVIFTVTDSTGNIYTIEGDIHSDSHDHSHGEIEVTPANLMILLIVLVGLVGIGYIGGITPLHSFFDEKKMRYLLAFSGGIFLATALFHALPEAFHLAGWISFAFVLLGFGTLYVIEHYVIGFLDKQFRKKKPKDHKHDHSGVKLHLHDHHSKDHSIITTGDVDPEDQVCSHHMEQTSEAAFFGVSLHNLVEGIVITTLFLNPYTQGVGLIVVLATILHKAPCTFSIASLLKMGGRSKSSIKKMVLLVLGMTPLGALLAIVLFINLDMFYIGLALAFSAGTFLEIGLLDLIPESIREKKGRGWAIIAIIVGLIVLGIFALFHTH